MFAPGASDATDGASFLIARSRSVAVEDSDDQQRRRAVGLRIRQGGAERIPPGSGKTQLPKSRRKDLGMRRPVVDGRGWDRRHDVV